MAATFGSLNLEDLGVVGEPEVEYAKFETEVSQPRGYDGGVLANFRRGATNIKFNLTLGGTRTEIHNKISALAAELAKGQQELILPDMTAGFHFDASANGVLKPVEHIDGFILPLEFVVPDGLAQRVSETNILTRDEYGPKPNPIQYASIYEVHYEIEAYPVRIDGEYRDYIEVTSDGTAVTRIDIGGGYSAGQLKLVVNSKKGSVLFTLNDEPVDVPIEQGAFIKPLPTTTGSVCRVKIVSEVDYMPGVIRMSEAIPW